MKKLLAFAIMASTISGCGIVGDSLKEDASTAKTKDVGARYWLNPASEGVKICSSPGQLQPPCPTRKSGSFVIQDASAETAFFSAKGMGVYYKVAFDDKATGYVDAESRFLFVDHDPVNCLAPRIGMTYQQAVLSCWGRPAKVNRTETPGHTSDQAVYDLQRYLYFRDGVLTSIQSSN